MLIVLVFFIFSMVFFHELLHISIVLSIFDTWIILENVLNNKEIFLLVMSMNSNSHFLANKAPQFGEEMG